MISPSARRVMALLMTNLFVFTLALSDTLLLKPQGVVYAREPYVLEHKVVFGEPGRFAGWPANHGIWSWGDEILVGFSVGEHLDTGDESHHIDRSKPEQHVLARSTDGGTHWAIEYPAKRGMLINAGGMRHGITDPSLTEAEPQPMVAPINFAHADFCMTTRFQNVHGGISRLYFSTDRGHHWSGPFELPLFGQPGVMARTDYVVHSSDECHLFLTVSKQDHKEGRVCCVRTTDGGLSWDFVGYVGDETAGFAIMPSTVRITPAHFVTTTRRREGPAEAKHRWIDAWESRDGGRTWNFLNDAVADVGEGNPPSLIRLTDGRLCLTYGDRKRPFSMLAKFSKDAGKSWSNPFVLRSDGVSRDMGYARSVQRSDGNIVTVYYFVTADVPYRKVVATIWNPGSMD